MNADDTVALPDDARRLRHAWVVTVICSRCGLTPDTADEWCHPHAER